MVGIRLIIIMAIVGGLIAYIADKMGSKIGKKKMSVFGLRPKHTSILLTVLSGVIISIVTICVVAISSNSARTALFGMEKIQAEIALLNQEKETAMQEVDQKNSVITRLDEKIKESLAENDEIEAKLAEINSKYVNAQSEVKTLIEAREKLNVEIAELEQTTEELRQGIITIREGQVFYRAGEIVYSGIMRGGLSHEENIAQVNWLLQNANSAALQRLGIRQTEENVQALWVSKKVADNAVAALDKSSSNMLFRVRTVANIIVGELVVCNIEMTENEFIYSDGSLIYSEEIDLNKAGNKYDVIILSFLNKVNHAAVNAGVWPDPLTGKVGNMDALTMVETSNALRALQGKAVLEAYADGDITTAGPVQLKLKVRAADE